jgi:hypothetical protein
LVFIWLCLFWLFCDWERVSLCNPCQHQTLHPSASFSLVLGLQVYSFVPSTTGLSRIF